MNKIQLPGVSKGPGNSTWPSQVHCRYCFQFDHKCYMLKVWILIWVYIFFNSHQPQIPQIPKLSFWPRLEHNSLAAQCSHSISFCTHHLQIMESVLDVTHCEKKTLSPYSSPWTWYLNIQLQLNTFKILNHIYISDLIIYNGCF